MLVRRRALQVCSAQCIFVRSRLLLYPRGGSSSPFSSPIPPDSPFFDREPLSCLTPLLCANTTLASGQVRRRADSDQTGVLFPPRGSHKALVILLSNLDREGV